MRFASPLRYPGGKALMAPLLKEIRSLNSLETRAIAEPFAGGAGASLTLLHGGDADRVLLNDLDPRIYDFWHAAIHDTADMIDHLNQCSISVDEWQRWREVYKSGDGTQVERGFATLYLNRCNRSGIIRNAGVIGGLAQQGRWKMDARFNKNAIRERLEWLGRRRDQITVSNRDGIECLETASHQRALWFVDPPYVTKGRTLYMDTLDADYHRELAKHLQAADRVDWVLTYDDCAQVRDLYGEWADIRRFPLLYSAAGRQVGNEVLISPRGLKLPERIRL